LITEVNRGKALIYISLSLHTRSFFFNNFSLSSSLRPSVGQRASFPSPPSSVGSVASPCNQVIIRWFVRAIMSVATSVAALVASRDDRDCPPGRAARRKKTGRHFFLRRAERRNAVGAFSPDGGATTRKVKRPLPKLRIEIFCCWGCIKSVRAATRFVLR